MARPSDPPPDRGGTQQDLVERLLALRGLRERRAFVADHAGRWRSEAVTLLKQACDQLLGSNPRRAIGVARLCHLVAQSIGGDPELALAERALAQACHAAGHYGLAVPLYERSAQRFERAGLPEQAGGSRAVLVDALMHIGRHQEALDLAAATRATLLALGERRRVALLEGNLGNGLFLLDRPHEALEAYDRARAILTELADSHAQPPDGQPTIPDRGRRDAAPGAHSTGVDPPSHIRPRSEVPPQPEALALARIELGRGNALAALNRPREAISAFTAAMERFVGLGMRAHAAVTQFNLAYVRYLAGQYGEALAGLEAARSTFSALDDRQHLALCLVDEAETLLALGRLDETVSLADRAWTALSSIGLRHDAARARATGAQALARLGRLDEALVLLEQARRLFADEQNARRVAMTYLTEAAIRLRGDGGSAALAACERAHDALREWSEALVAEEQVLRARALRSMGRRGARTAARRALSAARASGAVPWLWQAHHLLGQLAEERGDLGRAARRYRLAAREVERVRGAIPTEELRISFQEDKQQLYEDMVLNALARDQPEEAFTHVERAKSRALVDLLAGGPPMPRPVSGDDAALAERIETLRAELAWLYNRVHETVDGEQRRVPGSRVAAVAEARAREAELQRLLRRLSMRHPDYVALCSARTADLAEVQALLPAGTILVEYFALDGDLVVFLVSPSTLRVRRLPGSTPAIQRALRRWHHHLGKFAYGPAYVREHADALDRTARAILSDLHGLLVAPFVEALGEADLLVVPYGPLHGVPFQALYNGRHYLIEERALSYAPSASILRSCLAREAPVDGPTLVIGVADARTPSIDLEVAAVAALCDDSTVLTGSAATSAALRAMAPSASRLHLATHAVFRADNPAYSAVRLAERWLTLHEIYDLDLRASLVTLSGCETGMVMTRHAEEVIGLVRGFLYAGAPTLVASMWGVDDAATATLMAALYGALRGGACPRTALRAAQLAGLRAGHHPYYWAPFMVIGRP